MCNTIITIIIIIIMNSLMIMMMMMMICIIIIISIIIIYQENIKSMEHVRTGNLLERYMNDMDKEWYEYSRY